MSTTNDTRDTLDNLPADSIARAGLRLIKDSMRSALDGEGIERYSPAYFHCHNALNYATNAIDALVKREGMK